MRNLLFQSSRLRLGLFIAAALLGQPSVPEAGMLDTPLPTFSDGKPAQLLGLVPTVIKNNGIETAFICTNLGNSTANIGVEVFLNTGAAANSVSSDNGTVLNVPVGATVTIATSGTAVITEDERISMLPQLRNGSGRIVATDPSIGCIAFMLDELHAIEDPATSAATTPTFLGLPVWICGNSTRDPLEQCDDGDTESQRGEGCRANCTRVACADPDDSGSTVAQDALFALQASVGLTKCDACVCDVDSNGGVTAVDALRILNLAVGLTSDIQCTPCT